MDNLVMKIHQEDIAWYLERAPKLGRILGQLTQGVVSGELKAANKICQEFQSFRPTYTAMSPFESQENHLGERFGQPVCVSVNKCVAHGGTHPYEIEIEPGDIVSIDAGFSDAAPTGREMYFDAAVTIIAGQKKTTPLVEAPLNALKEISKLTGEINTARISAIIHSHAKKNNLDIVSTLTGHGIGYRLHTAPQISNVIDPRMSSVLIPETFICPEPMYVANGTGKPASTYLDSDGWSVIASDLSSHWETTFYYDGTKLTDAVGILEFS